MAEPISHQIDVYSAWVHLARNRKEWKALKKHTGLKIGKVTAGGQVVTRVGDDSNPHFFVYIAAEYHTELELVDTCAHEATHVAHRLFEFINEEHEDSEPFAYLVGWVTAWLWTECQT